MRRVDGFAAARRLWHQNRRCAILNDWTVQRRSDDGGYPFSALEGVLRDADLSEHATARKSEPDESSSGLISFGCRPITGRHPPYVDRVGAVAGSTPNGFGELALDLP